LILPSGASKKQHEKATKDEYLIGAALAARRSGFVWRGEMHTGAPFGGGEGGSGAIMGHISE
jgi:hypothetical protein